MKTYRIIGNMTGNSMDAMDFVFTEFSKDSMRDICTFSKPYCKQMQQKMAYLRQAAQNKTRAEIESIADFKPIHDEYITELAACIDEMCSKYHLDKTMIDAIGFHGKTLDHNPPSVAQKNATSPYTLQIGSGQMLADLTLIPVVYDFRSDYLLAGFDGAPLIAPHNAHIAKLEGDGCYYNGGNTSNFAFIKNGIAEFSSDAGPCNEYIDDYIRKYTDEMFDKNAMFGQKGRLNTELLQQLFAIGRKYYETALPKSGDPAYYHREQVFEYIQSRQYAFCDVVHTLEYYAAYVAVYTLSLVPENMTIPSRFVLFGGGWKNPLVRQSFINLLTGLGYVLPEHRWQFAKLSKRMLKKPEVLISRFGEYMEARAFADLARYRLDNQAWPLYKSINSKPIISGVIAHPSAPCKHYADCINRAAKGWQI